MTDSDSSTSDAPCGEPGDVSCVDEGDSSSGGTSDGSGSGSGSGSEGSTTGPECMGDGDCMDPVAPFCDPSGACVSCNQMGDPDGACAGQDPALPVCEGGACVQCSTDNAAACEGMTPVCGEDNECVPCTEHDECPESACHLDGEDRGACFDLAEVVEVQTEAELRMAASQPGAGRVAIHLTGNNYALSQLLEVTDDEVAIIGAGAESISRNGDPIFTVSGTGIVYLSRVAVENGSGDGLNCSGTSVWLDDTIVRNNAQAGMDISGGCAAHLRRGMVSANGSGGIVASGSPVYLVNTAVGENVDTQDIAGIRITNGELWVSYSSIVANLAVMDPVDNIQCFGTPAGEIRNSIVVAMAGNSASGCGSLTWENNGLDADLSGTNVSVGYAAGWFDPAEGDFHLTTTGETTFTDIAMWQEGEPTTDVDGDPIPTDMPSFPGYDQP